MTYELINAIKKRMGVPIFIFLVSILLLILLLVFRETF